MWILLGAVVMASTVAVNVAPSNAFKDYLTAAKRSFAQFVEWFGKLGLFCQRLFQSLVRGSFEGREFLRQLDSVGSKSLPLVALAGAATGAVISMETRDSLVRLGAKSMLPAVIIFSLIKETAPIITGLVVSGRAGAGIGAELGSMKVTEQIDAMEASAVNSYRFLAATRVVACIVALPLLALCADACGTLTGWAATTLAEPMSLRLFLKTGLKGVTFNDFLPPTFKTAIFGLIIGLISSFQGMNASGGTEGVGRAATSSVVLSSLFIILADVLLVRLIIMFFPG
jgi:phospholipid/cholesterol/gamma-HCH transport system permease protein